MVTRADAALISRFRQAQYRRSPDLTLTDESVLLWDKGDDLGIVLAVRAQDGSFLSTMRAEPLLDAEGAARALDCPVPIPDPVFPAMILGRGATRGDCQHLGLNSLMRFHFLRFARERGVRHIYGRVYGQAARTNLMRSIGYTFFRHPKGAEVSAGTAGAHSDLHIAVLDLEERGWGAIRLLKSRISELLTRFPLVDQLSSGGFPAGELPRTTHPRQASQEAPRFSGALALVM
ncbi:MAG: hypothetical protein L0191_20820 [Acidobacteria bacterium]|nr:hypothetical protein [Acidobacteriota bacterium]